MYTLTENPYWLIANQVLEVSVSEILTLSHFWSWLI